MTNLQFAFALIGGIGAFLGAAWIVAQAITKTASNPVYDVRLEGMSDKIEGLKESIGVLFERVDEMPSKVISILRNTGVIKGGFSE